MLCAFNRFTKEVAFERTFLVFTIYTRVSYSICVQDLFPLLKWSNLKRFIMSQGISTPAMAIPGKLMKWERLIPTMMVHTLFSMNRLSGSKLKRLISSQQTPQYISTQSTNSFLFPFLLKAGRCKNTVSQA